MTQRPIAAIVLAAGEGSRMRSDRPKPIHPVCGRPMVMHVIHSLGGLPVERTAVVVGHGADRVSRKVAEQAPTELNVTFVEQRVQRGTGDAVIVGMTAFESADDVDDTSTVVVMPGDTPLLRAETITALVEQHEAAGHAATILTAITDDPAGYGRIVRDKHGRVARIVEHKDATEEERAIKEWNTGIFAFRRDLLGPALRKLSPDNAQGEYYLTDVISLLATAGYPVGSVVVADPGETQGVNDRFQLAMAERELRARTNKAWMLAGVTMFDPRQTFIDVTVTLGRDVTLFPGTILQGDTSIGAGCEIGPDTRIIDSVVEDGCVVENSVVRKSIIGAGAHVGPYASLAEGAKIMPGAITGPFADGS
jgi:bifunctional UDP-N-acetylglucosamine pyrophosphorylase / glucosamine-1-phosphate N-acetyltransferase